MSLTASDNSKDLKNNSKYHDNTNNYENNLQPSSTDMLIPFLANPEKMIESDKQWKYKKEEKEECELDDHFGNYLNNNNHQSNNINNYNESYNDSHKYNQYDNNHKNDQQQWDNNNNEGIFQKKNNDNNHFSDDKDKNNNYGNETNNNANINNNNEKQMSNEEIMLEKLNMLRKLAELKTAGVTLSQAYNMNSDLNMMKYEYELHKNIRAKQNGINWMSSVTLNLIWGLEMANEKYNPFDLKLSGWSEQINADINNYYDVFGELYEKYNQPGKNMAPEVKLLLMISGSALKFHLQSSVMSRTSTLNDYMMTNPQLAEEYRKKAVADKLRDQTINNNNALNNMMSKEHQAVAQKANDLQLLKEKELEYLNLQKKQIEIEELKKKLSTQQSNQINTNNTQNYQNQFMPSNNQTNQNNYNSNNLNNQNNNTSNNLNNHNNNISMIQNAAVQRMMTKVNQPDIPQNNQLLKQQLECHKKIADKQVEVLEMQQKAIKQKMELDAIAQLQKIKKLKSEEENMSKSDHCNKNIRSATNSEKSKLKNDNDNLSVSSSRSEITIHNFDEVFSKSKDNVTSSDHQKIVQIDTVDEDDISNKISLGGKSKRSKGNQSKSSSRTGKKKNGISINL